MRIQKNGGDPHRKYENATEELDRRTGLSICNGRLRERLSGRDGDRARMQIPQERKRKH